MYVTDINIRSHVNDPDMIQKNTIWNVIFYVAQIVSMYNPNIVLIIEHEDLT